MPAAKPFVNLTTGRGGVIINPPELRPAVKVAGGIAERIAKYKADLASLT